MNTLQNRRGYSLLELLISMTLTVLASAVAVLLLTKYARTAGAYGEITTLEETRASAESVLRSDFDGAGFNLTRPSAPAAGKQLVLFLPDPQYSISPGTLQKLVDSNSEIFASPAVSSGLSLWAWTPSTVCKNCSVEIKGSDGRYNFLSTYYDEFGTAAIYIWEFNAGYVASSVGFGVSIPNHIAGDSYQIGIEAPNQQQTTRFMRYYRVRNGVRTILYTSQNPLPAAPNYMGASMNYGGSALNNISVIGAPIVNRVNNQTEFARLPFVGGTQLTSPVTVAGNSTVILSGDKSTDVSPALSTFSANSTQIDLKTPQRGTYNVGDTILVVDYGNTDPSNLVSPASAACIVTAVSNPDSVTTRLSVTRARQSTPATGGLWSSDTDQAHTFSASETIVVKLTPPVTYTVSTDSRLVRVEGYRVNTVAFNVRQFTVNQTGASPAEAFSVSAILAAEGVETAGDSANESRSTIEFMSTPRAMNLASNQSN